jgi:peptidoglycan/xylan/chitin deacetylase (PgdA/CDA1 family)
MRVLPRVALGMLSAFVVVVLIVTFAPRVVTDVAAAVIPGCLYEVKLASPQRVALTIDDSPDAVGTAGILDTLRAYGAHATFFVITDQIPDAEVVMRRILQEGHEIGNHFTADLASIRPDSASFERDLHAADSALRPYGLVRWARPGSGWYSPRMVRAIERSGHQCALGTVYPLDGTLAWGWLSNRYILAHVRPGAVIVLHDRGRRARRTAQVLGEVLPKLRARGYEVVTLSRLTSTSAEQGR